MVISHKSKMRVLILLSLVSSSSFCAELDEMKVSLQAIERYDGDRYKTGLELSTKFSILEGEERRLKHLLDFNSSRTKKELLLYDEILKKSKTRTKILNNSFYKKSNKIRKQMNSHLKNRLKVLQRKSLTSGSDLKEIYSIEKDIVDNDLKLNTSKVELELANRKRIPLHKIVNKIKLNEKSTEQDNLAFIENEYNLKRLNRNRIIDSYEVSFRQNDSTQTGSDLRVGFQVNFNIGSDSKFASIENRKYINNKVKTSKKAYVVKSEVRQLFYEIIHEVEAIKKIKNMSSLKRLKKITRNKKLLKSLTRNNRLGLAVEHLKLELSLVEKEHALYLKIIEYGILTNTNYEVLEG